MASCIRPADNLLRSTMKLNKPKSNPENTQVAGLMTLDEFIFEQLKSLEDFESSWCEMHRKNNEIYPLEMLSGDWAEQLALFRARE